MILVDTSVWIRFLRSREPWSSRLVRLLEMDAVAAHEMVYGEILMGDSGGRREMFSTTYQQLIPAATVAHDEVIHFVRHHSLNGSGMGWIDAHLLASARAAGMLLWTADAALAAAASRINVLYEIDT